MRKGRPWYFLTPSYWFSGGSRRMGKHAVRTSKGVRSLNPPLSRAALLDEGAQRDPDVLAEERRMQDLLHHRTGAGASLSLCRACCSAVRQTNLSSPGLLVIGTVGQLPCCVHLSAAHPPTHPFSPPPNFLYCRLWQLAVAGGRWHQRCGGVWPAKGLLPSLLRRQGLQGRLLVRRRSWQCPPACLPACLPAYVPQPPSILTSAPTRHPTTFRCPAASAA